MRVNFFCRLTVVSSVVLNTGAIARSMAQEAPPNAGKNVIVAADGSGDFKTVQEAVNAVPSDKNQRFVIHIKPGTYKEKIAVPVEKPPITFLGEDAATTILTFDDLAKNAGPNGKEIGTGKSATVSIQAPDFQAEKITFENTAGPRGRAVAVNVSGDRGVFRKCRFLGWQDTLLTKRNRQYFEDCYIAGSTDFICGASTAWFERCHLHERQDSYITAASTPQEQPFGYVFSNCIITAEPAIKTLLGRPWRGFASVTFRNTTMHDVIRPEGWDNWGKTKYEKTVRYAEYGSKTPEGKLIDLSQRVAWAKRLSAEEAKAITLSKVLGEFGTAIEGRN